MGVRCADTQAGAHFAQYTMCLVCLFQRLVSWIDDDPYSPIGINGGADPEHVVMSLLLMREVLADG
jgi:hypothetical protein